MTVHTSRFALLRDFARETSSDRRRELLRQATDMFMEHEGSLSAEDARLLDEIVDAVTPELSAQVRTELATKIANSGEGFFRTAKTLALDDIAIARPVLERSRALSERDLLDVVAQKSTDHMVVIAQRQNINERVSRALVERGEDRVVVALLENETAAIDDETYDQVGKRAESSEMLHAPVVRRRNVPLYLLNDLYFRVETALRQDILHQFAEVPPDHLNAALEQGRKRLAFVLALPREDMGTARQAVDDLDRLGRLTPAVLVPLYREGPARRAVFIEAFARLTEMDRGLIEHLVGAADLDALATLCRAADFERPLFVTLAALIAGGDQPLARVAEFGAMYLRVPAEAARRAIRFWRIRTSLQGLDANAVA